MDAFDFLKSYNEEHQKLNEAIAQKQSAFLQHILLLSSTLLGILVSLGLGKSIDLLARYFLVAAMSLLSLGILTGGCSLYTHIHILRRLCQAHHSECQRAAREHETPKSVYVEPCKIFAICEILCYISLGLSILALASYGVFATFS